MIKLSGPSAGFAPYPASNTGTRTPDEQGPAPMEHGHTPLLRSPAQPNFPPTLSKRNFKNFSRPDPHGLLVQIHVRTTNSGTASRDISNNRKPEFNNSSNAHYRDEHRRISSQIMQMIVPEAVDHNDIDGFSRHLSHAWPQQKSSLRSHSTYSIQSNSESMHGTAVIWTEPSRSYRLSKLQERLSKETAALQTGRSDAMLLQTEETSRIGDQRHSQAPQANVLNEKDAKSRRAIDLRNLMRSFRDTAEEIQTHLSKSGKKIADAGATTKSLFKKTLTKNPFATNTLQNVFKQKNTNANHGPTSEFDAVLSDFSIVPGYKLKVNIEALLLSPEERKKQKISAVSTLAMHGEKANFDIKNKEMIVTLGLDTNAINRNIGDIYRRAVAFSVVKGHEPPAKPAIAMDIAKSLHSDLILNYYQRQTIIPKIAASAIKFAQSEPENGWGPKFGAQRKAVKDIKKWQRDILAREAQPYDLSMTRALEEEPVEIKRKLRPALTTQIAAGTKKADINIGKLGIATRGGKFVKKSHAKQSELAHLAQSNFF